MRGDSDFAAFVELRGAAMLRTAILLCAGDRAAGQDLLQGALERVLRRWRIRPPEHPEAYVRRAMVNAAVRRRSRRFQELPAADLPESSTRDATAGVPTADALRRALANLPARQRAAVVLRFYDDLSEAETAAVLGCSVGTVKSSVSRGLARLRVDDHTLDATNRS